MAAPWDPSAQTVQWDPRASLQPPPLRTWIPPKPFHRQAAEISLWTVLAAMQAVERKVDLQAGRLCGLERRAGLAEKKLSGVERAVAEFSPHLDALGTLMQEYGQLQKRLENVENLLKNRNFWILGLPPGSGGEVSQIPVNLNEVSVYFSEQEWESLEQVQEDLPENGSVSLSEGDASSKSRTEGGEALNGESPDDECSGEVEDSQRDGTADVDNTVSSRQLGAAPAVVGKWDSEERAALAGKSPDAALRSPVGARAESGPGNLAVFPSLPTPSDQGAVHFLEEGVGYVEGQRAALRGGLAEPPESGRSFTTIVVQEGVLPGEAPYVCPECEKSFLYEEQYLLHQQTHSRGLGGSSATRPGVSGHTCPECGHWFPQQASLSKHRLWHSRERPHTCPECQKSFRLKIHLHLHERSHAASRKVGSYICGECGRSFSHHSNFLRHQMIHTGQRPYACGECGKTFIRKEHLATHGRLHTGERPFRCPLCQKSFTRKQHLVGHQRLHEGQGAWPEDGPPRRQPDSRPSATESRADAVGGGCLQGEMFPP